MSQNDSDNEYEEDYEDEFEPEGSGEVEASLSPPVQAAPCAADCPAGAATAAEGDTEVVSLEEYMKRLEDMPGADGDEDDGNDIMDSITRGLDGLSPSPSARGKGSKYGDDTEEDSDDAILKKFNVQLSPRSKDKDDFLEQFLRKGDRSTPDNKVSAMKAKYGYHDDNMEDIARLVEHGTHDRSVPNDAGLKVIELKKKVTQLQDRLKRDAEIKAHLKSICTSLKNELMTANQKVEYMYAELQSKKKSKPKKKPAAKTKVSAENVALRECVASLQDNETALVEKIEALSAMNNELNLQLKQSISREMDWRSAHQELSDRVLKQFNSPERKKGSISVGNLHSGAPASDNNGRIVDHGYGKPKRKPEFKLDGQVRSESDPRGRRKAKKLPPL